MVIYLHGFASGTSSSKATYIGRRLREHGVPFDAPDLNLPDFSTLTVTRMLEQTAHAIDAAGEPVTLIGSSLGGFVAVNMAVQRPADVKSLILLAPALDFASTRMRRLGDIGLEEWKASGRLDVFHYGYGRMIPVHYELYEDARRYDAMQAPLDMPILIFQGRHDEAVDPAMVEAWASSRPNADLRLLDDDHQLTKSLPYIWTESSRFLGLKNGDTHT